MPEKLYHECIELISQSRETLIDLSEWGFETALPAELDSLPVFPLNRIVSWLRQSHAVRKLSLSWASVYKIVSFVHCVSSASRLFLVSVIHKLIWS